MGNSHYFDRHLADISVPSYKGETYQAEVPDTLTLAERAQLAINCITRVVDPAKDYQVYFNSRLTRKPPVLVHRGTPDYEGAHLKFLESLPLMRIMSGSDYNIEVDKKLMESILHITGEDGLHYITFNKVFEIPGYLGGALIGHDIVTQTQQPYTTVWLEGRALLALCVWYQRDKNNLWKELIEKKVNRLLELAVIREDYCYFSRGRYYIITDGPGPVDGPMPMGFFPLFSSAISHGAAMYYRLTGYEPAIELAGRLARGLYKHGKSYDEEGRFLYNHFHHSIYGLIGMLEYALAADDEELIQFVQRGYEYGKAVGEPAVGFFPERPGVPGPDWDAPENRRNVTCETCEVADMIVLALKLTNAGIGDYWEDADCWVRNQYVENQMTGTGWADNLPEEMTQEAAVQPWEDGNDAVERNVGAWAGWATANDFNPTAIMHCCTGNAARTLYYVWDSIVAPSPEKVQVNLLLNRPSRWLDVLSCLPYEGKVILKIKKAKNVAVRIPDWTNHNRVKCNLNGKEHRFAWSGNYLELKELRCGDIVIIQFPMQQKSVFKVIGEVPYKLTIKGNTVVDIDPEGKVYPLYRRRTYRLNRAPVKKATCFVSNERIKW